MCIEHKQLDSFIIDYWNLIFQWTTIMQFESYIHFLNTFLLCIYIYTSYLFVYIYNTHISPNTPPVLSPPPVLSVFHPFFKVKDYEAMRRRCATYLQIWSCHTKTFSTTAAGFHNWPPWGWGDVTVGNGRNDVFSLEESCAFSTPSPPL